MNEKPLESLTSEGENKEEKIKQGGTEVKNSENISDEVAPVALAPLDAPSSSPNAKETVTSASREIDVIKRTKAAAGEHPVDWFEPLEDDDDAAVWDFPGNDRNLNSGRDAEEESLAGESEKSGSIASSDRTIKRVYQLNFHRRRRAIHDEGWVDWPVLGEGWKRKEVIRRSGSSIGQKDVYYLSPQGDRVRSRVELTSVLEGMTDLSTFDFKSGKFYNGDAPQLKRGKRKMERSSSESSWMDRGEGADTPDSYHRFTPTMVSKLSEFSQKSFSPYSLNEPLNKDFEGENAVKENRIKLPYTTSSRLLPSINGPVGSEETSLVCSMCGVSFTGTWYDRQRKRPCCSNCWASKPKEHPLARFRKWIPCGQCVACRNAVNCGQCANCKHGLQSPESRKRICRKRKCICPIRKSPGSGNLPHRRPYFDPPAASENSMSIQSQYMDSQDSNYQNSDTEDLSVNVDIDDDDDMSTDDDDDWHKKRKRRSCGKCNACLCRKDCGTCDFCIDKPKFGGSNKKRQKCRLRQCQRQAMLGQAEYGTQEGLMQFGRPRPQYTYSRKMTQKRTNRLLTGLDFTDNEDDTSRLQAPNWNPEPTSSRIHQSSMQFNHSDAVQRNGLLERSPSINHTSLRLDQLNTWDKDRSNTGRGLEKLTGEVDEEEFPMITRIFSLAENAAESGLDMENQLLKLLEELRSSALPILWYAIVTEGPQLQLIQCAKQSSMIDTMVLIDPGFCYQVTVQKQPLLLTHPLYDEHPTHLTSVGDVTSLLLDLERYNMCQGLPPVDLPSDKGPIILERSSICDLLVKKNAKICTNCRALSR